MKQELKEVYIPVEGDQSDIVVSYWEKDDYITDVLKTKGYFFTPEKFNTFVSDLIKDTLETAAEKAKSRAWIDSFDGTLEHKVKKDSITNQFNNIFEKYKV